MFRGLALTRKNNWNLSSSIKTDGFLSIRSHSHNTWWSQFRSSWGCWPASSHVRTHVKKNIFCQQTHYAVLTKKKNFLFSWNPLYLLLLHSKKSKSVRNIDETSLLSPHLGKTEENSPDVKCSGLIASDEKGWNIKIFDHAFVFDWVLAFTWKH